MLSSENAFQLWCCPAAIAFDMAGDAKALVSLVSEFLLREFDGVVCARFFAAFFPVKSVPKFLGVEE